MFLVVFVCVWEGVFVWAGRRFNQVGDEELQGGWMCEGTCTPTDLRAAPQSERVPLDFSYHLLPSLYDLLRFDGMFVECQEPGVSCSDLHRLCCCAHTAARARCCFALARPLPDSSAQLAFSRTLTWPLTAFSCRS
jgi:hypothetical protein